MIEWEQYDEPATKKQMAVVCGYIPQWLVDDDYCDTLQEAQEAIKAWLIEHGYIKQSRTELKKRHAQEVIDFFSEDFAKYKSKREFEMPTL